MTIATLAQKNVFLGTSSWKYPGWRGLVYQQDYASEKEFKQKCLLAICGTSQMLKSVLNSG